jgi:hypothetical protein
MVHVKPGTSYMYLYIHILGFSRFNISILSPTIRQLSVYVDMPVCRATISGGRTIDTVMEYAKRVSGPAYQELKTAK